MPGIVLDALPELSSLIYIIRLIYRTPPLARICALCFIWCHLSVTRTPRFQSLPPFFRWGNGSENWNNLPTSGRLIGGWDWYPALVPEPMFATCLLSPTSIPFAFYYFSSPSLLSVIYFFSQSFLHLSLIVTYRLYFLTWQSGSSGVSLNFSIGLPYSLSPTWHFSNFNSWTLCRYSLWWPPVKQFHFSQDILSITCACWQVCPLRLRSYSLF